MSDPVQRAFFNTRAAHIARQSLDLIAAEEVIGMVVAQPGLGKTECSRVWRRKRGASFRHVWIEADVLTSCRPILNALVESLNLGGVSRTLWAMKQAVCEGLAKDPIFVGIDEADLLTVRTFDMLRSIWDSVSQMRGYDGDRGFPLALLGTPKLRDMLQRADLERLRRRTFHKAELPALNMDELRYVLKKWPGVQVDEEGLAEIARLSRGSFGWLNVIVPIAAKIAAKDGKVVTGKIARATAKYVIGLPEE